MAPSVAWASRLVGAVIERGGQVCRETVLECKEHGLMQLLGAAPFYDGVIADIAGGRLQGSSLSCLALSMGSSVFSVLSVCSVRRMEGGVCGRRGLLFSGVLGSSSYLVLTC